MSRSRNYSVSNAVFKVLVDPGRLFNLSVKWFFFVVLHIFIFIRSCRSWCLCYFLWFIMWLFSWKIDVFAIFCDEVSSLPPSESNLWVVLGWFLSRLFWLNSSMFINIFLLCFRCEFRRVLCSIFLLFFFHDWLV